MGTERLVEPGALSRVEGEGKLRVVVRDGAVSDVELNIFEPPRFFEAFVVGRPYTELPDITARICGICPVAYQLTACEAVEDAFCAALDDPFVATPGPEIERLRRLLYCGEWLQSHALHVYFLHAPDFFGCNDAVELGALHPEALHRGLFLKNTGNKIMTVVGGRAVHPVNVRVGGFYKAPSREAITALEEPLRRALAESLQTVEWVSGFAFPEVQTEHVLVALRGEGQYPIEAGQVASSDGLRCAAREFAEIAVEEQVARSSALHSRLYGRLPYLTGPAARYAINSSLLPPLARAAATHAGLGPVCRNPFRSIVIRAVEMVAACEEALRVVSTYEPPRAPAVEMPSVPASELLVGAAATEAPRGLLMHHYELQDGLVRKARIMPPTSQNQLAIEADLRAVAESSLELSDEQLAHRAEMAVRNHDPCISCAAHFLDVRVERQTSP
ncbi:MAG TPA: Ni/Fe hydrogenase subunit alpha [Acidimicrobiales bacterium]|nr:Ni/Fe hydrogenase subunit alpha [Acidimicrobiales bacterium]